MRLNLVKNQFEIWFDHTPPELGVVQNPFTGF